MALHVWFISVALIVVGCWVLGVEAGGRGNGIPLRTEG